MEFERGFTLRFHSPNGTMEPTSVLIYSIMKNIFKRLVRYLLLAAIISFIVIGMTDHLSLGSKVGIRKLLVNDWIPLLSAFILGLFWKKKKISE